MDIGAKVVLYGAGEPLFVVTRTGKEEYKESGAEFVVQEVEGYSDPKDIDTFNLDDYLECWIKWDGCSHFTFGRRQKEGGRDGYLHLCGNWTYRMHRALMRKLYMMAYAGMGRDHETNDSPWGSEVELEEG